MVRATKFFSKEDDGLLHDWFGTVFMNSPFGGLASQFGVKLLEQFGLGHVTAAIAVLPGGLGIDNAWVQPMWNHFICLPHDRIRFTGPGVRHGATQYTTHCMIAYLGPHPQAFEYEFAPFGHVVGGVTAMAQMLIR